MMTGVLLTEVGWAIARQEEADIQARRAVYAADVPAEDHVDAEAP